MIPANLGHRFGIFFHAIAVAGLLVLQGCASLPDAEGEISESHKQKVELEGARGPVSAARSKAIIERLEGPEGGSEILKRHLAYEEAVNAPSPLVLGNKLTLLQNGPDTYQAMFAAIRQAKQHINLETYIFDDSDSGKQFADLLLERQAAGVQVSVIYDSVGCLATPKAFFDRLRDGGVRVVEFNPVNPLATKKKKWLLNNRDHRRQLLIDGRIAFTGGVNISNTYSSAPSGKRARAKSEKQEQSEVGWRDTHIQIEGPVVAEFQKMFMDTWARQKGEPFPDKNYFPELKSAGDEIVRAIGSTPADPRSQIYRTLISAISHAETSVHLTIAYFAPDPQLLRALTAAARRGVDVRLVLPSYTDSSPIFYLGRSYYTTLLTSGVKIYQWSGAIMHAKTACIDGVWSTVGSTNLDWRSFLHNDEINAVILSRAFADEMERVFAEDLTQSEEIVLEKWRQRGWMNRVKERMTRVIAYWL